MHPNDHVNMGQSSQRHVPDSDAHRGTLLASREAHSRAQAAARRRLGQGRRKWVDVVKIGRTHLQDATPLTVGQEWSGYVGALDDAIAELEHAAHGLLKVAVGGRPSAPG